MGLLSIQEPEDIQDEKPIVALGIDLGTTHSLVGAYLNNEVVLFQDSNDQTLLPSVVLYTSEEVLVGHQAIQNDVSQQAIYSVKRFMGKSLDEVSRAALSSSALLQADENQLAMLQTEQGVKSPVQISAEILKKLLEIAKMGLAQRQIELNSQEPIDAVITVPAYFDDGQRQATKAAAEQAGMNVLRLLNEPTAAALAYGYDKHDNGIYLVYDLGGGTFDVSILRFQKGIFEVLATAGDTALGGDDMDACIVDYLKLKGYSINWQTARALKEKLTIQSTVEIPGTQTQFSRAEFETLIQPLINKTLSITQHCIQDAKLTLQDFNKIILVGGATRVPAVSQALNSAFGLPIAQEVDPDKVVAMGATLQAAKLIGQAEGTLLDVVPLSLGIELMGGVTEKIISRNTKLPVSVTQTYTTYQDNQTGFKIHVVQGERELVKDNRSLARFELNQLPALPQGKLRIAMTFTVDVDGLLTVTAKETITNQTHSVQVKPTYGLTRADMDAAILKAAECAKADVAERQLIEAKREANKLMAFAQAILLSINQADKSYTDVSQALMVLQQAIEQNNSHAIVSHTKQLEIILAPISLSCLSEVLST